MNERMNKWLPHVGVAQYLIGPARAIQCPCLQEGPEVRMGRIYQDEARGIHQKC
jgi:hypothetical protein